MFYLQFYLQLFLLYRSVKKKIETFQGVDVHLCNTHNYQSFISIFVVSTE